MGNVYAEISLKNTGDVLKAREGTITEKEIRQTTVRALVDTGAWTLVINEAMRKELGLHIFSTGTGTLADGTKAACNLAGPVEVGWKDRSTNCDALILAEANEALLGAIPLEAMDLMVHPRNEELVGVHGDQVIHRV